MSGAALETGQTANPVRPEIIFRVDALMLRLLDDARGPLARTLWVRQQVISFGTLNQGVIPKITLELPVRRPDGPTVPFHLHVSPSDFATITQWAGEQSPHLWCRTALNYLLLQHASRLTPADWERLEKSTLIEPVPREKRVSVGLFLSDEDVFLLDAARGDLRRSHWIRSAVMSALHTGAMPDGPLRPGAPPDCQHLSHRNNPNRLKVLLDADDAALLDSIRGDEPRSSALYRYLSPYLRMVTLLAT